MKRVMIIGCCGAGKSTLSRNLQKVLNIPLHHLDQYYWKENWVETPTEQWSPIVRELAEKDTWIIDGNYGGTMDIRFEKADTVIYLQYPTWKCLWRVLKRIKKYNGQVRPDIPEGCHERFDWEFIHFVATYNLLRGKKAEQSVKKLSSEKKVFILKNDKEVARFLKTLQSS